MFYLDLLQGTQSKSKVLKAVSYIGNSKAKFRKFIHEFTEAQDRDAQKLAWIIGKIADAEPDLLIEHVEVLLKKLQSPCHAAVKRNVLRAIDKIELEEDCLGVAADVAFGFLEDRSETVAVRVFSMSILHKICLLEPELAPELISLLEDQLPLESAGFVSRAKKTINNLTTY